MINFTFWLCLILIFYTYVGFPIILVILVKFKARPRRKAKVYPSVSLIIAAYNEEKVIEKKIKNSLSLDYPKDKLEIIVASDGSTDKTNNIVKKFSSYNVKLFISKKRNACSNISSTNGILPKSIPIPFKIP